MQHTRQGERRPGQGNDAQSDGKTPIREILSRNFERIMLTLTGALIVAMLATFADMDTAMVLWAAYGGLLVGCSVGNLVL